MPSGPNNLFHADPTLYDLQQLFGRNLLELAKFTSSVFEMNPFCGNGIFLSFSSSKISFLVDCRVSLESDATSVHLSRTMDHHQSQEKHVLSNGDSWIMWTDAFLT